MSEMWYVLVNTFKIFLKSQQMAAWLEFEKSLIVFSAVVACFNLLCPKSRYCNVVRITSKIFFAI